MKFLTNKTIALVISIILAIAAILISTNIKLSSKCEEVESKFYNGVDYDGYVHSSISTQLSNISNAVNGIIYIANNNGIDSYKLSESKNNLDSCITSKSDISSIYINYTNVIEEYNYVIQQISKLNLSERDNEGFVTYQNTISNATNVINQTGYNEYVNSFIEDTYNKFPTKILAKLSDVKEPSLFS